MPYLGGGLRDFINKYQYPENWFLGKVLYTRNRAVYRNVSLEMVRDKLELSAAEVNVDVTSVDDEPSSEDPRLVTGIHQASLVDAAYEWEIAPREDAYHVEERIYWPRLSLLNVLLLPLIGAMLSSTPLIDDPFLVFGLISFVPAGTLLLFAFVLSQVIPSKSGIDYDDPAVEMQDNANALVPTVLIAAIATGIGTSLAIVGGARGAVAGSVIIGLCVIGIWVKYDRIGQWYIDRDGGPYLPSPAIEYVMVLLLASSAVIFRLGMVLLDGSGGVTVLEAVEDEVAIVIGFLVSLYIVSIAESPAGLSVPQLFRDRGDQYVESTPVRATFVGLSIVCTYLVIAAVLVTLRANSPTLAAPAELGATLFSLLPLGYFGLGLCFQTLTTCSQYYYRFEEATPAEFTEADSVDPPVSVFPEASRRVEAYDDGFRRRIFVSRDVVENLEPVELRAVLAHEEAHIVNSTDSFYSTITPLLSLVTLLGQNVMLMLFDYRKREFEADRYAVEKTGDVQSLLSALETLDRLGAHVEFDDLAWFKQAPILTPGLTSALPQVRGPARYFLLFYAGLSATKIHPSLDERQQYLAELRTEEPLHESG